MVLGETIGLKTKVLTADWNMGVAWKGDGGEGSAAG